MLLIKISPEKKVRFISGLGLVILVLMGWFSYNSIAELFKPFGWITHTQAILEQIGALANELTDVQSSARGYVLSGDKKYLRPYHVALWSIPNTVWEINNETGDNPAQQSHLVLLKPQIKTFIALYTQLIRLRRKVGEENINAYMEKDSGFNAMNTVMQTVNAMSREERRMLILRDADEVRIAQRIRWTIILIILAAALILVTAGININRHILAVKTINEKHQAELKNLAIRDELTGLFNRRGFMTLAEQQLKMADRSLSALLLVFIDLDGFKQINDQGGHPAGDALLIEFAQILQAHFRKVDIVGRLGGDEFAILTEDRLTDDSMVIHRLRETLEVRNQANPQGYRLDCSVGTALYHPDQPCGLEQLISQADERMYAEKEKKKNKTPA